MHPAAYQRFMAVAKTIGQMIPDLVRGRGWREPPRATLTEAHGVAMVKGSEEIPEDLGAALGCTRCGNLVRHGLILQRYFATCPNKPSVLFQQTNLFEPGWPLPATMPGKSRHFATQHNGLAFLGQPPVLGSSHHPTDAWAALVGGTPQLRALWPALALPCCVVLASQEPPRSLWHHR